MKKLSLLVTAFLLTVYSAVLYAIELSWASPSNNLFKNIPVNDRIIPLGFSKKSVFSYLLQQNSCQHSSGNKQKLSLLMINLITDKILEDINLGEELPDISVKDVLHKYRESIQDLSSQYEIEIANTNSLTTSKMIKSKSDLLTIESKLIKTVYGEDAINPGYRKYKILLSSKTRGAKTLAEIKSVYEPLRYWGYFKSPFEERIAGLFVSTFRGCEAFPQMRINIVGANLNYGFKSTIKN